MRSVEQAAKESTLRPPYMTRTEFESIALPLLAARDREWAAELTALREQLAAVEAERDEAREERERLRHLAYRQEREIGDLQGMADSAEALRRIGNVVGCGHVDDPDGRRCLVACVEQVLTKAESRASAAEAEAAAMRKRLAGAVWMMLNPTRWFTEPCGAVTHYVFRAQEPKLLNVDEALEAAATLAAEGWSGGTDDWAERRHGERR